MEIVEYSKGQILIVMVKGKLDAVSSPELDQSLTRIMERGERALLLDFRDLEYVSSAGIRVLYRVLGQVEAQEGKIVIAGPGETVKKVFDMVELAADIPVYGDLESALNGF